MTIERITPNKFTPWKQLIMAILFFALAKISSPAQVPTTLVELGDTNTAGPQGTLVQGLNGNVYGVTSGLGTQTTGSVYEMTPSGSFTTLYTFTGGADGGDPIGGLIQAGNGVLYGTTFGGGINNTNCRGLGCGTVFGMTPTGKLTTIHRFAVTDGYGPLSAPTIGMDGNLYGTTSYGGSTTCKQNVHNGCGTVYKITSKGQFTTLHIFCQQTGCTDGDSPRGSLVQASNGVLYGVTFYGGATTGCKVDKGDPGCGTLFQISSAGVLTTLHAFLGPEGSGPGVLIQGADGDLYGTTSLGGANGFGTIFKYSLSGTLTKLYDFSLSDGQEAVGLTQATDNNFYGLAFVGGANSDGTIFEITPANSFSVLYDFSATPGKYPQSPLLQATSGKFIGTTNEGGTNAAPCYTVGCGTIFSLDAGLGPFVTFAVKFGKAGQTAEILGQGFRGATAVSFNGVNANFAVQSDTSLRATVPSGAATGYVTVTTPSGTLTSNVVFQVLP